ncbi:MAG: putative threonine efflux protein [Bryobacterales bacterium]|nr:putative threonine efflux protein [Bryobacterales bacterium]
MISLPTFIAFLTAALLLAITPGPGIMYVLTRTLAGGRREGILSSLGTFVGGFVHVIAAGLGVSVVLATSAVAYQAVRWAGAAYLVYLGIRMFRSASEHIESTTGAAAAGNPFAQGIATEVLNPKTALFFLSFIPQFVNPKVGPVFGQFLLLGAITVVLNTSVDLLVALFAGPIGQRLLASRQARRNQRRATGAAMIGLGVYVVAREA